MGSDNFDNTVNMKCCQRRKIVKKKLIFWFTNYELRFRRRESNHFNGLGTILILSSTPAPQALTSVHVQRVLKAKFKI